MKTELIDQLHALLVQIADIIRILEGTIIVSTNFQ